MHPSNMSFQSVCDKHQRDGTWDMNVQVLYVDGDSRPLAGAGSLAGGRQQRRATSTSIELTRGRARCDLRLSQDEVDGARHGSACIAVVDVGNWEYGRFHVRQVRDRRHRLQVAHFILENKERVAVCFCPHSLPQF